MGNRAVLYFKESGEEISGGVYLHWNGGPETIYTALDFCKQAGCRMEDAGYLSARFVQVMANFLSGTLSIGLLPPPDLTKLRAEPETFSHGDNGIYVIENGKVTMRAAGYPAKWLTATQRAREANTAAKHEYNKDDNLLARLTAANPLLPIAKAA